MHGGPGWRHVGESLRRRSCRVSGPRTRPSPHHLQNPPAQLRLLWGPPAAGLVQAPQPAPPHALGRRRTLRASRRLPVLVPPAASAAAAGQRRAGQRSLQSRLAHVWTLLPGEQRAQASTMLPVLLLLLAPRRRGWRSCQRDQTAAGVAHAPVALPQRRLPNCPTTSAAQLRAPVRACRRCTSGRGCALAVHSDTPIWRHGRWHGMRTHDSWDKVVQPDCRATRHSLMRAAQATGRAPIPSHLGGCGPASAGAAAAEGPAAAAAGAPTSWPTWQ
jgi:hypothetical protein